MKEEAARLTTAETSCVPFRPREFDLVGQRHGNRMRASCPSPFSVARFDPSSSRRMGSKRRNIKKRRRVSSQARHRRRTAVASSFHSRTSAIVRKAARPERRRSSVCLLATSCDTSFTRLRCAQVGSSSVFSKSRGPLEWLDKLESEGRDLYRPPGCAPLATIAGGVRLDWPTLWPIRFLIAFFRPRDGTSEYRPNLDTLKPVRFTGHHSQVREERYGWRQRDSP